MKMKMLLPVTLSLPTACLALHPLVSDDTGTQGRGNFQLEVNSDNSSRTMEGTRTRTNVANATLTYGLTDAVDIAANLAYQRMREGGAVANSGMGDPAVILKWRFYENNGCSLALKPQVSLSRGDESKGLGNGRTGYAVNTLVTCAAKDFTVLGNAGYIYNGNSTGDRKSLWSTSAALLVNMASRTRLAFDFGTYRSPDPMNNRHPAFALAGLIHSPADMLDVDVGFKKGLNRAEVDHSFGVGLTIRW